MSFAQCYLRSPRSLRRSRHSSLKGNGLGQIKNMASFRERPASVEDRAVPGHWEGDLIAGPKNSYIATLVERHSRYVMLVNVKNRDTQSVVSAPSIMPTNYQVNSINLWHGTTISQCNYLMLRPSNATPDTAAFSPVTRASIRWLWLSQFVIAWVVQKFCGDQMTMRPRQLAMAIRRFST